jgi:hypothetical protein
MAGACASMINGSLAAADTLSAASAFWGAAKAGSSIVPASSA